MCSPWMRPVATWRRASDITGKAAARLHPSRRIRNAVGSALHSEYKRTKNGASPEI